VGPAQRRPQLLVQRGGHGVPTARKRTDHYPVAGVQFIDDATSDVAQPPRHAVSLHCVTDGLPHDQTDPRRVVIDRSQCVHDEIGLDGSYPSFDRQPKIRRPRHPVPGRKHRAKSCV
jgi:hypothetical protein